MYLSTSTSTEDFPEMYLSTFQVLYKLYLSTDVLKYKVLLPGSGLRHSNAGYRGTSRELGYNGSAQHRPQVGFQNEFQYILFSFKILKNRHASRIHPVEWFQESQEGFYCWVSCYVGRTNNGTEVITAIFTHCRAALTPQKRLEEMLSSKFLIVHTSMKLIVLGH